MAGLITLDAEELVDKFANQCAGAHFSNEKALGQTTMAYGLKSNNSAMHRLTLRIEQLRRENRLFSVGDKSSTESIMLHDLWDNISTERVSARVALPLLSPLYVSVRGSMVDSISTLCVVQNVFIKTPTYLAIEANVIMDIILTGTQYGRTPQKGTISEILAQPRRSTCIRSNPTFKELMRQAGAVRSQSFATAALDVLSKYAVVKRGFDDSGARFRDNSSRTMAKESYQNSLANFVFVVKL